MVNLYINAERIDLQGKETIAGTYAIAPFSDISKRTSFQTISFNVPKTANNRRIFENANVVVNDSILPYAYLEARLDVDGVDQRIRSCELVSVKDVFQLKLYGGNIDFFSLIKDRKLTDLDLSAYDHTFDRATIIAARTNTGGYIYPIVDFHSDSPNTAMPLSTPDVDVRWLFPAVFIHTLVNQIVVDAGFVASGDFLTDSNYMSCIQQCVSKLIGKYKDQLNAHGQQSADSATPFVELDTQVYDPLNIISNDTFNAGGIFGIITVWCYNVQYTGKYNLQARVYFDNVVGSVSATIWKTIGGVTTDIDTQTYIGLVDYVDFDLEDIDLVVGEKVWISITGTGTATTGALSYLQFTDNNIEDTTFGKNYDVAANLPDIKQSDLIKTVAQMFGLFITVDNENEIVYFNRFTEIIDNKQNALDWTDKVDYSEPTEINFKDTSYGQSNSCTYQDDETVTKPNGTDYELLVSNTTLKPTNKLFESVFAASESVERLGGYQLNQIKIFTDAGGTDEEIAEVEPRILILRRENFSPALELNEGAGTLDTISTNIPLTHFIEIDQALNIGWENNLIPTYSQEIADTITRYKMVVALLRLNVLDINQLDFTIPVWIEFRGDSGAYFYISEIKQFKFTSRESTEVELIKLP